MTEQHVVFFSGGITSWACAMRVAEQHGTENLVLLFADTLIEDEDTYRFVKDAAAIVGGALVTVADGRTPWGVFRDKRMIGNSRVAQCSDYLKTRQCQGWLKSNADPKTTTLYFGLDWTEPHRADGAAKRWEPWRVEFPLMGKPYLTKTQTIQWARGLGLEPPRLYAMGFQHGNCGGFCVRAGQKQMATLLTHMPERYAHHEQQEESMRQMLGREDVAILTEQVDGVKRPLTLRELRERIERYGEQQVDMFDWGACGCFIEATEGGGLND